MHFPDIRRVAAVTASAALAAVMTLGGAGAAQAAPEQDASGAATASTAKASVSAAAARSGQSVADQASNYWTPERMRTAISADTLVKKADTKSGTALGPTGPARSVPAAAPTVSSNALGKTAAGGGMGTNVNASATVGKVFFYNPANGGNYVCSAGTVNSGSKLLVMSAGHCVHGGAGGQWMQNWVFVPYYNYGSAPYGQWSAKYLTTFNAWINSSDLSRDVSWITVWPNSSNQALVNVVGGNGIMANYPYQQFITILAYPAAPPYDGGWQQYCQGNSYQSGNKMAMNCGFTGGSSGSLWLQGYSDSTTLGNVDGIMSTLDGAGVNRSSYFDTAVWDVYVSVANRT
ncbi:hypothetical protein [Micromonospora sp. RTGN7]|uniref:trypsin-like serine peptidase n=1 Tax=Micromonospora sp. RTGN7 TaxID=3016526 RepID=UPI0029FEDEF9|nr:hypothetical protein [Micromonospora sp. RTGN7]